MLFISMTLISARVALVCMSRRGGIPVNRLNHHVLDGGISVDDLDIGVGMYGSDESAHLQARLGIYQFVMGRLVFRHAITFDHATGFAKKRLVQGGTRELLQADCAMVNWIRPLLFNQAIHQGAYRWKSAPRVPWAELDQESRREFEGSLAYSRPREFFSLERRTGVLFEMFGKHLEASGALDRIDVPEVRVISCMPGGSLVGDGDAITVSPQDLRRMVMHQFASGLKSQMNDFHLHCGAMARAFQTIKRMVDGQSPGVMIRSSVHRFSESLLHGAEQHLARQKLEAGEKTGRMEMIHSAIRGLERFSTSGSSPVITMTLQKKREHLEGSIFFDVVRPSFPVQLLEGVRIDSHLPEDGEKLFT